MRSRRPIAEASEVIHVPLERVLDLVLTVHPGPAAAGNLWLLSGAETPSDAMRVSGGPVRFDVHSGQQHVLYVDVDRDKRTVGVQGHWWYRGEYTFDPDPAGTRMTVRVLNVAPGPALPVKLANKFFVGYEEKNRQAARDGARRIETELTR